MLKMLRDSGASNKVMDVAKRFSCEYCLQRGRRALARPATTTKVTEKWQCLSIDTFWWHTPKEVLDSGEKPTYVSGLSIVDEATDFHADIILKTSQDGPITNISGEDFKRGFSKGWLHQLPAPSLLRYDEEGFMRKIDVVNWLELFGMKLEPISGEGAWQLGKHSRHLQTLKEQMNLLSFELGSKTEVDTILSLCLSAKNSLHQIRGYSPNQWALGQNHGRISSFLQQNQNLLLLSAREEQTFEDQVQAESAAQRLFLQIDARRRISRAMNAKCRAAREFALGDLVYFFRKGPKQGSRYGGSWHGPARVLAHEKTSGNEEHMAPGSVVWIVHAGKPYRCAPKQLRHVTHDLRHLDAEINGPQNFHTMLEQISNQQKYMDLSQEDYQELDLMMWKHRMSECRYIGLEENKVHQLHITHPLSTLTLIHQMDLKDLYQQVENKKAHESIHRSRTPHNERVRRHENEGRRQIPGKLLQGDLYQDREYTKWVCRNCDESKKNTSEGMKAYLVYLRRRARGPQFRGDHKRRPSIELEELEAIHHDGREKGRSNKRQFEEESDLMSNWSRVDEMEGELGHMKLRLNNMEEMMAKILAAVSPKQ